MSVAAAPLGLTDIDPVGCPITGALEAIPFHKGFQETNGMAVFLYPVAIDTPGDPSQDVTSQVWSPDPGQNQEPHVVGHQMKLCSSCRRIPADELIPGSALPGCRAKEKSGKGILLPVKNEVFDIFSYSTSKTEIMVPGKETLEETQKTGVFNQLDAYRLKLAQRTGNRGSFVWDIRNRDLARAPAGSLPPRQGNMAPLL
jgi:hypothetical protein